LFRGPIVLDKYGTLEKPRDPEESFVGYTRIVFGATYREFGTDSREVMISLGDNTGKGFFIDSGTELLREGPGYRFQSGGGLYTIGPIMVFHNLEFFSGLPITPFLMSELFATTYSFLIPTPSSPEALIENVYIQKYDRSFLTRKNLRWVATRGPGSGVAITQISTQTAAMFANALDRQSPLAAQDLDIPTTSDPVES
jgi:hypothetical protein